MQSELDTRKPLPAPEPIESEDAPVIGRCRMCGHKVHRAERSAAPRKTLFLRIDPQLHDDLAALAHATCQSLNQVCEKMLEDWMRMKDEG